MLGGFGVVRVPLLLLVLCTVSLIAVLLVRVVNQFYFNSNGQEIVPLVGYSAVFSIAGYAITNMISVSAVIFYGVTNDQKIPGELLLFAVLMTVAVIGAKYTLFTVRLKGAFQDSVYKLTTSELYRLYLGLSFTLFSGIIAFILWRRHQSYDHPRKISSAVFVMLCALSHVFVSVYFIWIFVGRLRQLLNKSTSLKHVSEGGTKKCASLAVHNVMNSISVLDATTAFQNGFGSGNNTGGARNVSNIAPQTSLSIDAESGDIEIIKSIRANKNRTITVEEIAVKTVIEDSEIEDKTMIVVMVRYTLLRIVSVTSSLLSVTAGAALILTSVDKTSVDLHETEIFIIFFTLDSCVNVLCLFFTFYSFGFSIFHYDLWCGRAESALMHCFEKRLKHDFFEQLLREAQTVLKDKSNLQRARNLSRVNTRKSMSAVSKTGLSSALI